MPMKNPPHPGLSILHDCLEPMDMTISEAARRLGISRKQLSKIVNGRAGISADMAIRLDKVFGGGASTWYHLQAAYDLAKEQTSVNRPADGHALNRKIARRKPLSQWLVENAPRGTNLEPPVRDD
ncbi:MAG: HigA family addiction module antidote protein [Chloroflexi bacterium]|nr:HigA family addiction module antidote protein [Chloroflexota bacterium]